MNKSYTKSRLSEEQLAIQGLNHIASRIAHMQAHGHIDMTLIRKRMKENPEWNYSAVLLKVFSLCLEEFPEVHAMIGLRNRKYTFDQIDILMPIEIRDKSLKGHVFRNVSQRTIADLSQEFKAVSQRDTLNFTPLQRLLFKYPRSWREWYFRWLFRFPKLVQSYFGSAMISLIPGRYGSIGVGKPFHSCGLYFGLPETNQNARFSVCADHNVVMGKTLSNFGGRLRSRLEQADFDYA